jgi:ribonuclease P protein component
MALAGNTVARTQHFALHRKALDLADTPNLFAVSDVWIGAMVPKRWAKRAVTRNAIKRQIYTACSEIKQQIPMAAHVVRLRSGFDKAEFFSASSVQLKTAIRLELNQLFSRVAVLP